MQQRTLGHISISCDVNPFMMFSSFTFPRFLKSFKDVEDGDNGNALGR